MKDTRTRAEKIRDLSINAGATDAERNAARLFMEKSTIDKRNPVIVEPNPVPTKNYKQPQQQAEAQFRQRTMAMDIQRRINKEMRQKLYTRPVNKPHSVANTPDYSGFLFIIIIILFLINYGFC